MISKLFLRYQDSPKYGFNEIADKKSVKEDVCAILIMERIDPFTRNWILGDFLDGNLYFNFNLNKITNEKDIHDLIACGIRYDEDLGRLYLTLEV